MNQKNTQKGIGLVAAIIIVAIVGIGGYSIYNKQMKKKAAMNLEATAGMESIEMAESSIVELSVDVEAVLDEVRTNLKMGTQAGIDKSVALLTALEASITETSIQVSAETKSELDRFKKRVMGARNKVSNASTSSIAASSDAIIDDIEASFDMVVDVSVDAQEDMDEEIMDEMGEQDEVMNDEVIMDENTDADTSTDVEADISVDTNDDSTQSSVDVIVETDLNTSTGTEDEGTKDTGSETNGQ